MLELKDARALTLLLASDAQEYAGTKKYDKTVIETPGGRAALTLTPYSGIYYLVD